MPTPREELISAVTDLLNRKFDGDLAHMLRFYDDDGDEKFDAKELWNLLRDANVGNFVTRNGWVAGVLAALDSDRDGKISVEEFRAAHGRMCLRDEKSLMLEHARYRLAGFKAMQSDGDPIMGKQIEESIADLERQIAEMER